MKKFQPPKIIIKKKQHKGRIQTNKYNYYSFFLKYGIAGLKAKESGRLTPKQLESVRRFLSRQMGRDGIIWFMVFPDISITKKPREVRMGKGKGNIVVWVAKVYKGKIILEIVAPIIGSEFLLLKTAQKKLPINTKRILFNHYLFHDDSIN
jgi:large subunit ribosomal protein L16